MKRYTWVHPRIEALQYDGTNEEEIEGFFGKHFLFLNNPNDTVLDMPVRVEGIGLLPLVKGGWVCLGAMGRFVLSNKEFNYNFKEVADE